MVDSGRFEERIRTIDRYIGDSIERWTDFLPRSIGRLPYFEKFLKHMMYVVMSFLNEENSTNTPQELFIQIPVQEFANIEVQDGNDGLQCETFQKTTGTIAACLILSTIESILNKYKMSDVQLRDIDRNKWEQGTTILTELDDGMKMFTWNSWTKRRSWRDSLYTTGQIDLGTCWGYKENNRIIRSRLRNRVRNVFFINKCTRYNIDEVKSDLDQIRLIGNLQDEVRQYSSAALVHIGNYPPKNERVPVKSRYFDTIRYVNNINSIRRCDHTDIIVALGDKEYINKVQEFRRRAFKKIIYIGSDIPAEGIPVYSFSYREIYRYCAPAGCGFKEPQMIRNIDFPWMDGKLDELQDLLNKLSETDESLTEDTKARIIRLFQSRFSSICFRKNYWEEEKYNIEIDIDCSLDTIDAIMEWCEQLEYDSDTNPKAELIARLNPRPDLVYEKYWRKHLVYDNITQSFMKDPSIRNRYISELKSLPGENHHIVIDCATYSRGNNDHPLYKAYKHLLKYHLYAHVTALYYCREDNYAKGLLWFLNKEFDCYDSVMRRRYHTTIERNQITDEVETISDQIFTLADFQDSNDAQSRWSDSESRQTMVTFSDGRTEKIDGDVLEINGETMHRVRIQKFEDEDFEDNEVKIFYYKTPEKFDLFMTAYFDFPEGADIKHYEDLWKTALRNFVSGGSRRELVGEICNVTQIDKNKIKRYLNENCSNKFLGSRREMKKICLFLSQKDCLPESEITWVMAAKKAYDEYKPTGARLKDEVLETKRGRTNQNGVLSRISTRLNVPVTDIVDSCLEFGTISSVRID